MRRAHSLSKIILVFKPKLHSSLRNTHILIIKNIFLYNEAHDLHNMTCVMLAETKKDGHLSENSKGACFAYNQKYFVCVKPYAQQFNESFFLFAQLMKPESLKNQYLLGFLTISEYAIRD